MVSPESPAGDATVTQRLLAVAPARGEHRALVGGPADPACGYADLAVTVQAAAAGLAWRGLQPRDAVGVYVPDAACYVLAAHAIRAAGGVPSPVAAGLTVPEIAGQLADCGARMLLTAAPLADVALAAADRSWVRQVISFGEAPDAIQFSAAARDGHPAAGRGPAARPGPAAVRAPARRDARPGAGQSPAPGRPAAPAGGRSGDLRQGRGAGRPARGRRPVLHRADRPRAAARRDRGGGERRGARHRRRRAPGHRADRRQAAWRSGPATGCGCSRSRRRVPSPGGPITRWAAGSRTGCSARSWCGWTRWPRPGSPAAAAPARPGKPPGP